MGSSPSSPPRLRRTMDLGGAVLLGLGSILGTGVFVSLGLAAGIAGPSAILGTILAALLAAANGLSSAQLAASHPVSGGTYEYGYRVLRPSLGFLAGWMFLVAKSASAATAALGFGGYVAQAVPGLAWNRLLLAELGVGILTLVVLGGARRSNRANGLIVGVAVTTLVAFVVLGAPRALEHSAEHLVPFFSSGDEHSPLRGLFHATALIFVAYTGYGRIATLGEEVRDPQRVIPRAIVLTLGITLILYLAVITVATAAVGAAVFAAATEGNAAPLELVARTFGVPGLPELLAVGAVTAMLGVLLNLLLGLSRVLLAMGRRGDMPSRLARVDTTGQTPRPAVLTVAAVVAGLAWLGDVRLTWSLSAFTVLVYYALTNLAALRLPREQRLFPRWISWAGLLGCGFLAFWVDRAVWLTGAGLMAGGLAWFGLARWRRAAPKASP